LAKNLARRVFELTLFFLVPSAAASYPVFIYLGLRTLSMSALRSYSSTARTLAAILALIGWFLMAAQLWIALTVNDPGGHTIPFVVVNFFSYFTILSNLLITVIFTWIAVAPPGPSAGLQAAAAAYIAVVGIGYSLLLRSTWNPEGLQKLMDHAHHDVMPVVYIVFWLIFVRSLRRIPWSSAFTWLIAPLLYLFYTLVRGSLTGWYPYQFLDPRIAGWPNVFIMIGGFLIAFLALGLAAVSLSRPEPVEDSAQVPLA
jgi:hypothetical protein